MGLLGRLGVFGWAVGGGGGGAVLFAVGSLGIDLDVSFPTAVSDEATSRGKYRCMTVSTSSGGRPQVFMRR